MRIVGGAWRGRTLVAPAGATTRPTADRLRQTIFDMLLHAPWAGRDVLIGAKVLDAFAGTGALGLEALSRGAAQATFIERDRAALAALRSNIAACRAEDRGTICVADTSRPPIGRRFGLVFLDPPYEQGLLNVAVPALRAAGWIDAGALLVVETGRDELFTAPGTLLAERVLGVARVGFWRID